MLPYSSSSPTSQSSKIPVTKTPGAAAGTGGTGTPNPWGPAPKKSHLGLIIGSVLGVIVVAGAAFAIYYLFFRTPLPNVALNVTTDPADQVMMGEPFTLTVAYSNTSDQTLQNANVAITVPDGISILGVDPSTRVATQSAGNVAAQGIGSETFQLVATGDPQSVKHIAVAFTYTLTSNQQAPFEQDGSTDVNVGAAAVTMNLNQPANVFTGQPFTMSLAYQNNSQTAFDNAKIILNYPAVFQFQSASPAASINNDEWDLGTLAPAASGTIAITGAANSIDQQTVFSVSVELQVDIQGQTYTLLPSTGLSSNSGIAASPLSIAASVNSGPSYIASLGDTLSYTLTYHNNSANTLQNVVIQATPTGPLLNFSSVSSDGTLNSVSDTLTWNTANTPALASLAPGASDSVNFKISLANTWPIKAASDKDYSIVLNTQIQSLTVPPGISAAQTIAQSSLTTKVRGQVDLLTTAYYDDPLAAGKNTGPYPPRVNQPTTYTIHWQIKNYSTDLSNVHLSTTLQSGATMVGVIQSNASTSPVYNSQTGQVSWNIPFIPATKGVISAPLLAVFQIQATPSINQLNTDLPLIGATTLTATDNFTNTTLQQNTLAKNASLPDDTQAAGGNQTNRNVQQ